MGNEGKRTEDGVVGVGVGVVQMGRGWWGVARRGGLSPTKEMEIWRLAVRPAMTKRQHFLLRVRRGNKSLSCVSLARSYFLVNGVC